MLEQLNEVMRYIREAQDALNGLRTEEAAFAVNNAEALMVETLAELREPCRC